MPADTTLVAYLPQDRRTALAVGRTLPDRCAGTALFVDISGFTALTEAITLALGPRRGGEVLTEQINRVYEALIAEVDHQGGTVIGFAGDAITCWFDDATACGTSAARATACALAQCAAMTQFAAIPHPTGTGTLTLAIKAALATGSARRFLVGNPAGQVLDVLAGATVLRMAHAEHLAIPGEIVVDATTAALLTGDPATVHDLGVVLTPTAWRDDPLTGQRFAILPHRRVIAPPLAAPPPAVMLAPETARPWLPAAIYVRLLNGQGEFLTELRPVVALFLRFNGLDYDADPAAPDTLDRYIRWVQDVVQRYAGIVLDLTVGDKGSYLYAVWGAPVAHEDDPQRALAAAQELRSTPAAQAAVGAVQIGLSRGVMRTGAVGSQTRRTYGVLGDEVNLTARLMMAAAPGQVLASRRVYEATAAAFNWEPPTVIQVKGKHEPVPVYALRATAPLAEWRHDRRPATPLVGREREQIALAEQLAQARARHGQLIRIMGEAGIGKSRLVMDVVQTARASDWAVYGGVAQSYGTHTPYLAWRAIWRAFFQLEAGADASRVTQRVAALDEQLVPRAPLLGLVLDLAMADSAVTARMDEKLRQESREALLVALIRARVADRHAPPLLLVLEDAHWLDPLGRDLLEALGRVMADLPVAVLVVERPAIDQAPLPQWSRLPHTTEIRLGELAAADAARLLHQRLIGLRPTDRPIPAAVVEALIGRAQGNPFYLEELVDYLAAQGVNFTDPTALAAVEWPPSLYSLVLSRIDQLAERQQRTLKVASIIGRMFRARWLWEYYPPLGLPEQVRDDLDMLARLDMTPLDLPEPDLVYLFKHIVTQEVAYSSLAAGTRDALHTRLAGWLEQSGSTELDLLAYHYERSSNKDKAREYLRRAGEAAAADYANVAAIAYYERLLALPPVDPAAHAAVSVALGDVLERTGAWEAAATRYRAALAIVAAPSTVPARAQLGLGVIHTNQGAYAEARTRLEAAQAMFVAAQDGAGASRVLAELGRMYQSQGIYGEAQTVLRAAIHQAEAAQDIAGRAVALHSLGRIVSRQGDYAAATALITESLTLFRTQDDQAGIAGSLNSLGLVAISQGDYPAARTLYVESLTLRRVLGNQAGIATSLNNLGAVAWRQGDWAGARTLHEESLALCQALGDLMGRVMTLVNLGVVASMCNEWPTAQARFAESLVGAEAIGSRRESGWALLGLAGCAARRNAPQSAARWLGAVERDLAARGEALEPDTQRLVDAWAEVARTALGAGAYHAAHAAGHTLTWQAAVAEVLLWCAHADTPPV